MEKNSKSIDISKEFLKPWDNFPVEAKSALENIIVSFKQNLRVINKAGNKYKVWKNENGQLKREIGRAHV